MRPTVPLRQALADPALLGEVLAGDSWRAWRLLLIASMGEALTDAERVIFQQLTQREREPGQRVEEFVGVVGRRGGKSRAISVIATYIAGLCEHQTLVRGECGVLLIIAPDQRQADIVLDYITAAFEASPILSQLIESRATRELRLTNHIDIEVRASDFRRLRGPTYIAVVADEVAFWMNDNSANPDNEVLEAVRPGLSTTFGPLFMISSPYARRGELWRSYQKHYGAHGDPLVLVAKGTSREFNATPPQSVVDRAMERDASSAAAEYGAEFRRDLESFVALEVCIQCIAGGVRERSPQRRLSYFAFADPSGGSQDSFSLAIAHYERAKESVVLDCLREITPPFSPEIAVAEFARLLASYSVRTVIGDRYAGIWPVELFARHQISYEQSAAPKSDLYRDLLPLLNSRRVSLLDDRKLLNQLLSLERRTARGGRDSIDHPPGAHDDLANALAGACSVCVDQPGLDYSGYVDRPDGEDPYGIQAHRAYRLRCYLESHGLVQIP